jgi:hypothetical protein
MQATALAVLRLALGRGWLSRPISVFVFMAVLYHGVSELILAVPTIRANALRLDIVEQPYIDDAALIISVALLAAVCSYVSIARRRRPPTELNEHGVRALATFLDWRVTAVIAAPLIIATVRGAGYNSRAKVEAGQTSSITTSLAWELLVTVVVITAFGIVARYGIRWFAPALAGQTLILASAGQRLTLVTGAVMLSVLVYRIGLRTSRRAIALCAAVTVVAVLGITSARDITGRGLYYEDSGMGARGGALATGIWHLPTLDVGRVIGGAAIRFDANAYAGQVEQAFQSGAEPLGFREALEPFLVVVPKAVFPEKGAYRPRHDAIVQFGIVAGIDQIAGSIGLFLGGTGAAGLAVLMLFFGLVMAYAERWVLRDITPLRILMLAGLVQGAAGFERGMSGILLSVRASLILFTVLATVNLVVRRVSLRKVARRPAVHLGLIVSASRPS